MLELSLWKPSSWETTVWRLKAGLALTQVMCNRDVALFSRPSNRIYTSSSRSSFFIKGFSGTESVHKLCRPSLSFRLWRVGVLTEAAKPCWRRWPDKSC